MNWSLPFLDQRSATDLIVYAMLVAIVTVAAIVAMRKRYSFDMFFGFLMMQFLCFAVVENMQVATEYAWDIKNINDTQVEIGKWISRNLPVGISYATNDIGAMGYYAPADTLVDVMGLIRPESATEYEKTLSPDITCLWVLNKWRPQYLVCFNEWFPHLVHDGMRLGMLEPIHTANIENNLTCGSPGVKMMLVYRVDYSHIGDVISQARIHLDE